MPRMYKLFALFPLLLSWSFASHIPSYVHLCKRHDPKIEQCVMRTILEIVPHLSAGIKEMNIPPLDPLRFQTYSFDTGSDSSVQVKAEISEGVVEGMRNIEFKGMRYDLDNGRVEARFLYPSLRVRANYKVSGKMMLFEVNGSGPVEFNATDVLCEIKLSGSYQTKNKQEYLMFDKVEADGTFQSGSIYLHNIFPGNSELNESLNRLVNENLKALSEDLKPIIQQTLGMLALDYFNRVYSLFPIKQLYPEN